MQQSNHQCNKAIINGIASLHEERDPLLEDNACCSVLQCVAVSCSELQCVAVCCIMQSISAIDPFLEENARFMCVRVEGGGLIGCVYVCWCKKVRVEGGRGTECVCVCVC